MNEALRHSCKSIFVQVAKFFLRYGLTYQDFNEVLKEAIVEAALANSELEKQQSSNANIGARVGLPRRTVSDIRSKAKVVSLLTESAVPAGVMLKLWHNDPKYLDGDGQPLELPLSKELGEPSVVCLAEDAGCSAELSRVVQSLKDSGAVETSHKSVRVKSRTFIMNADDENTAVYFGIAGSNLLSTLVYNTTGTADSPFFERTTWVSGLSKAVFPRFSELVSETSVPFLELLDDWLMHRQSQVGQLNMPSDNDQVLGVGIYVFNRENEAG